MRDEMLKRLDEIIATAASVIAGADCGRQAIEDEWPVLRAELAAERCDHCVYFVAEPPHATGMCRFLDARMFNDGFCNHFAKKEPTP